MCPTKLPNKVYRQSPMICGIDASQPSCSMAQPMTATDARFITFPLNQDQDMIDRSKGRTTVIVAANALMPGFWIPMPSASDAHFLSVTLPVSTRECEASVLMTNAVRARHIDTEKHGSLHASSQATEYRQDSLHQNRRAVLGHRA
jgi:hypothetical protein